MTTTDEMSDSTPSLGKETPVRLGLIMVLVGFITGATWWAASIDTSIKSMARILTSIEASIEVMHGERIRDEARSQQLESRLELMNKTGTEAFQILERRVTALEQRKP